MTLSLFLTHSQPGDTLHSITDSAHASLVITKHHKPSSNRAFAYAVRKLYYNELKDRHVTCALNGCLPTLASRATSAQMDWPTKVRAVLGSPAQLL